MSRSRRISSRRPNDLGLNGWVGTITQLQGLLREANRHAEACQLRQPYAASPVMCDVVALLAKSGAGVALNHTNEGDTSPRMGRAGAASQPRPQASPSSQGASHNGR